METAPTPTQRINPLRTYTTTELDRLFADVMREMRSRDSSQIAGEVVTNSQGVRLSQNPGNPE